MMIDECQQRTGLTSPAGNFCWIADHLRMRWYIFRYHRAGAYQGIGPDFVAADDGSIRTDTGSFADARG